MLYPIKFYPIYKSKVWGGNKIKALKNENNIPDKCGESWELSGVEGDVSVVKNGFLKDNTIEEIIEVYMGDMVGDKIFEKFAYEFPILLKIIEANENLSIQVHPDDATAEQRHNARGKSEAWYILETLHNAKLISGFNKNSNFAEMSDLIKLKNLETILNQPLTKPSEVYYIPSGRVHSLGKGNLIVEIQQTSDVTYRIYDYDRTDRELHLDLASDVIDYKKTEKLTEDYSRNLDKSNEIIKNSNFTINYLPVMNSLEKDYFNIDSFIIYYCIKGELIIKYNNKTETLKTGETVLIPAALKNIVLIPKTYTEMLEIYLEL
ncbi:MAG: class I mannose-6-phosphate isomerase [Bacteroidales bacterium]|nr:class I mannose-6-phosphate isomerase [Bacteroidales bacterium]